MSNCVHVNINPIKAFVCAKFLYDMDEKYNNLISCEIIGISSYKGNMLTFRIVVSGGIFDYIPLFALTTKDSFSSFFNCVYMNCPDIHFSYDKIDYIEHDLSKILISLKNAEGTFSTKSVQSYLGTIDWYNKNENGHLFISDHGFYLVPNYRLMIDRKVFPDFKKINSLWKL